MSHNYKGLICLGIQDYILGELHCFRYYSLKHMLYPAVKEVKLGIPNL